MEPRRRFRFLKQLSEGTFGRVYMAEMVTDNNFSSVVAIKLLHGKWLGHEEIVQRSRDEARVLGLLHHRNIIRVEDLTSINNQCAVIMEYLDGVDLKSLINFCAEQGIRIPFKVIFEVMSATASALEAAYFRQPLRGGDPLRLIHRDIKPSNIMLTREGDIKVLDFGTAQARFEDREAKTQALAFGSQAYMAPERLLGDPDAPTGDIFSVGVTLYELIALESFGKIHIRPEQFDDAIRERVEALDFSGLEPSVIAEIKSALYLLLRYDATQRPDAQQVLEMMEDLSELVNDASLRRFCREVVGQIQAQSPLPSNPDDRIAGSTLFEDVTNFEMDEPPLNSSPTMAFDSPLPADASAPSAATPPPIDPNVPDPNAPADPGAPAAAAEPAVPDPGAPPVSSAPPPVPSSVQQTASPELFIPTPAPTPVPKPAPAPAPAPEPASSGGGRWMLLAGAGLLLLLVLGGGGAVAVSQMMKTDPATPPPDTPVADAAEPEGIPGQRLEHGALGPDSGTVILRLKGARASVKIDAATRDFSETWDGTGELEIVGLPAGTYKTRIKSVSGTVRTTVEAVAEKVCTYTFTVGGGVEEWNRNCQ